MFSDPFNSKIITLQFLSSFHGKEGSQCKSPYEPSSFYLKTDKS